MQREGDCTLYDPGDAGNRAGYGSGRCGMQANRFSGNKSSTSMPMREGKYAE